MNAPRYASFDNGKGCQFERGKLPVEELAMLAHTKGEPEQISGRQEYYENLIISLFEFRFPNCEIG